MRLHFSLYLFLLIRRHICPHLSHHKMLPLSCKRFNTHYCSLFFFTPALSKLGERSIPGSYPLSGLLETLPPIFLWHRHVRAELALLYSTPLLSIYLEVFLVLLHKDSFSTEQDRAEVPHRFCCSTMPHPLVLSF